LCGGSRLATCYSKALKRLRNLQYVRRPGPDPGCSAIAFFMLDIDKYGMNTEGFLLIKI
jgi:hypothetical protein